MGHFSVAMRKITLFMMVSLDGFFEGQNHDLSWHHVDNEFNKFAIVQLKEAGLIFFGRRTYELFESFWPKAESDPRASKDNLEIAHLINNMEKIVFSRKMKSVKEGKNWKNVTLRHEVDPDEIKRLKQQGGKGIWIGGSSDLSVSLIKEGLIDEFRIMINPVVIGNGKRLFVGLNEKLELKLVKTRNFKSGNVLLYFERT
ncbi:MAG: dihydrofolate reductase [Candidatus Micrarchaeota archaeon]|nr:dihydrofolate reductase [Candidatus Micrarchaeota archaeon]MDE1834819.1 dihydrofolate reductase [Candidatus Micrarchaeota archaeon]MDE1859119.1 dihydrofolate reductase [Candidatus Micrarchaeota archaeon]